ncbi:hypothetical protein cypCar_00000785, partial [Cyprinus carpio]
LEASQEQVATLQNQLNVEEDESRSLEQRIRELQQENQPLERSEEDSTRDAQRYRTSLGIVTSEKKRELERQVSALQQQLECTQAGQEALRSSSLDVQRQRDLLRQQREDLERQLAQECSESERGAEKESLESGLLDRQELTSMLEADWARLVGENASLQQANKTLTRCFSSVYILALSFAQEHMPVELCAQREQAVSHLWAECEELCMQSRRVQKQLQEELAKLQQHCTESLPQAESHKQWLYCINSESTVLDWQVLSEKEAEKDTLTERIITLEHDIETAALEKDRMRRDFLSKQEQDKVKCLRRELIEVEESRDSGRKDLMEAHRELRGCLQDRDTQRFEGLKLKRGLGDVVREKEAIQASYNGLRTAVKRAEFENNSLRRVGEEKDQRLTVLVECKSSLQQEVLKLRTNHA